MCMLRQPLSLCTCDHPLTVLVLSLLDLHSKNGRDPVVKIHVGGVKFLLSPWLEIPLLLEVNSFQK